MSVATLRPPSAIYREEQYFAWWLYVLLALMVAIAWFGWAKSHADPGAKPAAAPGALGATVPLSLAVGLILPPMLVFGVLRMTTEVNPVECRVWFGIVPTYRRAFPLDAVRSVEIVRYRPIRDHGFWGVRTTKDGERILTARGDRAVRLVLSDGSRVLIGSQDPEALASALDRPAR